MIQIDASDGMKLAPLPRMTDQAHTAPTVFTVPPGYRRARADKVLAAAFPDHSRVALQRSFDAGVVLIAGKPVKRDHAVSSGDVVEFSIPETKPSELKAVDIPLDVLYEDKHLLALNKAAGMIVHPGAGTGEDTLVHALLSHCAGELSGIGGVERPGIVHRLDRETSGVMLVAKTDAAHRGLSEQFSERTLRKEYVALVSGTPTLLSGSVRKPIGRNPNHRHKMAVVEDGSGGRDAHTDWEVVEKFGSIATLVRCTIHTGRTHQIRVHMKSLGHVLLGDEVYGWKADPRLPSQPARVMLHAEHLVVKHPITGKTLELRAPLPKDFKATVAALKKAVKTPLPKVMPGNLKVGKKRRPH
jgi:23S rRNA pseudouridine1911/1915/1917 synthase